MNALKVIIYFSIFKYPLTKEEVFSFSTEKHINDLEKKLLDLVDKKIIYKFGQYYSDINDLSIVNRRLKGNQMAKDIMPKALKKAKFIMQFPYIESVCLSGALAKDYYDDSGDIDFFIITTPKHLWLARTLLILYKKLILLNSNKYFCINYFIGSNKLEIEEQNRFTATELLTLIPIYGDCIFHEFFKSNNWATHFFPNKKINTTYLSNTIKKPLWSKIVEVSFNNTIGEKLDAVFKVLTLKKWTYKFKHLKKKDFEVALKSTNDVSKHHPRDFQNKVIGRLNERYHLKNKTFNLNLAMENA